MVSSIHQQDMHVEAKSELDSHADTTVTESNCRVLEYTEKSCDVYPFSNSYEPLTQIPIAKVATAYDHPLTGETFILIFGQALYFGDKLEHTLICPNQAHYNGVIEDNVPRHLSHDRRSTHSLFFPDNNIRLPLQLNGVISYINTRYPKQKEIDECRWLIVTSDEEWESYDSSFAECEEQMSNNDDTVDLQNHDNRNIYSMNSETVVNKLDVHNMDIASQINRCCSKVTSSGRKLITTDETIAKIFQCSPQVATKTRLVTTQKGVRRMSDHISRRFRTKQAALRYNQLGGKHGRFYTDTMFASTKSLHGNIMGQILVNDIGYTHFTPMKAKSEVPYALQEFIQDVGIPSIIHSDGAPELSKGHWKELCRMHGIKETITEPHSPFQNRAEINIRELKKQTRRLMQSTSTPLRLWDMCACYVSEL
jgi:hypothetical protein